MSVVGRRKILRDHAGKKMEEGLRQVEFSHAIQFLVANAALTVLSRIRSM
jgi:hypothetical protein